MMKKSLAIITARGGSKRIPRKNVKLFNGIPVIVYSIRAALASGCFTEVMVSTDDNEIAEIAKKNGAIVPFIRSEKNANDFATTNDVIVEVLAEYSKIDRHFDFACCIYPTAPFVSSTKLQETFKLLTENDCDSVIPVCRFSYPIQRALKISNHKLFMAEPSNMLKRSQDLEPMYHDAGQFYWLNISRFLVSKVIMSNNVIPYEVSELEVQDIDTLLDWKIAELKYTLANTK